MKHAKQSSIQKRLLALTMAIAMVFTSLYMDTTTVSAGTETSGVTKLVDMAFSSTQNNVTQIPYVTDATGKSASLTRETDTNSNIYSSSYGLTTVDWNESTETQRYWQIAVSTKDYENLKFSATMRSSNTGPAKFKLSYSTDGTNYTDLTEEFSVSASNTALGALELPTLANDQDTLYLRITKNADIRVKENADMTVPSTGTSSINNIILEGTLIDGRTPIVPPSTETPSTETPSTEKPSTETPSTETPSTETPSTPDETPVVVEDPISSDEITAAGAISIADAYASTSTEPVTVMGQVAYVYGKNGSLNSTIIEDAIDNKIVGLQIYNKMADYKAGDVVSVTGTLSKYGEVLQLGGTVTAAKVKEATPIGAQTVTIKQLLDNPEDYVSEYVKIKNATLGTYNTGNTPITDATGTMNIYQGSDYTGIAAEGDSVTIAGVFSKYNKTYQMRNGLAADSYIPGVVVDSSITMPIATWGATKDSTTLKEANADLNEVGDNLDTSAKFFLSTGANIGLNTNSDYYYGSKGLTEGQYYQMNLSTKHFGAVALSFKMRASNTGAKNWNVLYSTDNGQTFEKLNTISYTISGTDYSSGVGVSYSNSFTNMDTLETVAAYVTYDMTFPTAASNEDNVIVRIQVADGSTAVSGNPIGASGVNRIIDINYTASPVIADDVCGVVTSSLEAGPVALGSELALSTRTEGAAIYYTINGGTETLYTETAKPVLSELPATVTAYAKKDGIADSVKVTYGYTQAQAATVKATPNGGAVKVGAEVKLSCETEDATVVYSMDEGDEKTWTPYTEKIKLTTLPMTIYAKATKAGYLDSEVKKIAFTERANENYNIYFGQIHSHTEYSDGAGTCEDAFKYASTQAEHIDFLAVTDHSNLFDNDTSCTIKDGSASSEWTQLHELAEKYTTDDFVALPGYEMTWSGGAPGHMNTFNTDGFLSRNDEGYKNGSEASLPNYYSQLKTVTDSISQFNHPGTTFGDFYDFGYYDTEVDQLITTIEVGNGEGAIGSSGYFPSYEYYTRALDKGWHVAPTNNQDNHKGKWGNANTGRTVVLADSLTEESIYDALRNMRGYATEDYNLNITYTLNDEIMGTIMEETPDQAKIKVDLKDEDNEALGKVEVIVNGGLSIASENVTTGEKEVTFDVAPSYSYYYIRVTEADGDIAVTAPVWLSDVEAVGISSVSTSASLPVKGEALDVTASLYNNEDSDFNVNSIVFSVDDEEIKRVEGEELTAAGLAAIAPTKEGKYTFTYTNDSAGSTNIYCTVTGTLNGVDKVYKEVLQLNYVDPSMVTRVVVDGTHNNDYVTGYYGGNVGNFADIAAADYVQVAVETNQITADTLKDCSLLVISAPAKKSGTYDSATYDVSHFEDDFIALVADYVKNGGHVILCGLADYQDSTSCQSSTEINKLLDAMGATTRLNSDELCDDDKNGGQNYRLYFDKFNMDSKYLDGVITATADSEGQTYSAYSAAGVVLNADAVAAGKADALVYGHDTTYAIDSRSYDSNYVAQDKGSIVALAHETVGDNQGEVFVGGTVFVSDFEIKTDVDNANDLQYANRNILLNILKSVKKQLPVSTIAEMRAGNEGDIFRIEGYVTAGTALENNKFFDTIYVQDETGGTTVFPIGEDGIAIGQKINITGYVDGYQGDKEIQVIDYELLDGTKVYAPTELSTKDAMNYETNGGKLVKVTGEVTRVEDGNYIWVKDDSGVEAMILTDGYILSSTGVDHVYDQIALVGNTISAVGLVYVNPDGVCLRTRDRAEITLASQAVEMNSCTVAAIAGQTYTGAALTPAVTVSYNKQVLVPDTDYTVSYKNNINAGTATVTITGKGNYTGTKTVTFTIAKLAASKLTIGKISNKVYTGKAIKPSVSVKNGSKTLKSGTDYTVSYSKNKATGKASVKITGKGNYTGTKTVYFNIVPKKLSSVKAKSSAKKTMTISWKKNSTASGYRIQYSTSSKMKSVKTVYVTKSSTSSKKITKLKSGKKYYVTVTAYKTISGKKVYGAVSKKVSVKVK